MTRLLVAIHRHSSMASVLLLTVDSNGPDIHENLPNVLTSR